MTAPAATYRLQFREGMDFAMAAALAPYLAKLGVSHLYASPVFRAAPGSTHGYDVIDFNKIEPSLGGEDGLDALVAALEENGLGLILDFVPNHMAATPHNPWWRDVLEWGEQSSHANAFDIDWSQRKLVVPALGEGYGRVLERGELSLAFDADDGGLSMAYYDLRLPLTPPTYAQVLAADDGETLTELANHFAIANAETAPALKEELATAARERRTRSALERAMRAVAADTDKLHALHESQIWQLRHWRAARETLTYRRFFEIADLVGVRMEQPSVFEETHQLVLRLAAEDKISGLRLDHVDGLADPKAYLQHLREAVAREDHFYIVVEKILGPGEQLRQDWPVAGTTGYEFILALAGLFTNPAGEAELTDAYADFIGETMDYANQVVQTKRRIFTRNLAGELDVLTRLALELAESDLVTRDLGPDTLRRAIIEVASALPIYRTYVDVDGPREEDRAQIEAAAAQAKTTREVEDDDAIAFIARLLLLDMPDPDRRGQALVFAARFQQTTGPLMAKALEDTLFYRFNRLIALNEVGGEPERFGDAVGLFHATMQVRRERQPSGLTATSTHDTKRGEDARARLYAISEAPDRWRAAVLRWRDLNTALRAEVAGEIVPEPNDEWLFYQALLGAWPAGLGVRDAKGLKALADRMAGFIVKAVREAKLRTSWTVPAQDYEQALDAFVRGALDPKRSGAFLDDFAAAARPLLLAGVVTSLAQTLIKLTAPGVPDLYQGAELWDLSLVDPDNRRQVDFDTCRSLLEADAAPADALADWPSGAVKLAIIHRGLAVRATLPDLFAQGRYLPIEAQGARADNVIAFARLDGASASLTVAARWPLDLLALDDDRLIAPETWGDATIVLPKELRRMPWRDALADRALTADAGRLRVADLFQRLPVALLVSGEAA